MMEKWFPKILIKINLEKESNDVPINNYFEENGFESKLFLKNIGSALIYFFFLLLMWAVSAIMIYFGKSYSK
jgi:hypothetical protein